MRQLRESCEKLGQGGKAGFKTFLPQPSSFLLVSTLIPTPFRINPKKFQNHLKRTQEALKTRLT